jgi:hypothetical protein
MIVAVAIGILAASAAEPSRSQHPLRLGRRVGTRCWLD